MTNWLVFLNRPANTLSPFRVSLLKKCELTVYDMLGYALHGPCKVLKEALPLPSIEHPEQDTGLSKIISICPVLVKADILADA